MDQELIAKFQEIRDPEEAYKLASSIQPGFTKEEFIAEMTRLNDTAVKTLNELTDGDLAKVAGGGFLTDLATTIGLDRGPFWTFDAII